MFPGEDGERRGGERGKDRGGRTTGNWAQTCVPWSGMMVKRTMESSRRSQQTLPREVKEAVNSVVVSCVLYW